MRIGIIGAGYIGRTLAKLAAVHGDEVMISNSRGPQTLISTASATKSKAGTVEEAAAFGDIVIMAIPFRNRDQLPAAALAGKIVADANNYYPHRDGAIPELDQRRTTTSEMIAALMPSARVVKAFNAILAVDLEVDGRPAGFPDRHALPIAGDDPEAKRVVAEFQDRIGYDVLDAGSLAESWRFERAKPGYCVPLDRAGMQQALAAARRDEEVEDGAWRVKPGRQPAAPPTSAPAPEWLLGFYQDLDQGRFGSEPGVFNAGAELRLGSHHACGSDQISEALRSYSQGGSLSHEITEYCDHGPVKVVRGEVGMRGHEAGPSSAPAFVHLFYMASDDPAKVRLLYGAAGPL